MSKAYIHKKTGKIYYYMGNVINATNAQDGQEMAFYTNDEKKLFVREFGEFLDKFQRHRRGDK